jgi:hypothetical protein
MTPLQVIDLPADRIDGEVVAALFFEDERPVLGPAALLDWRLNGLLSSLLVQGRASGRAGENILVRGNGKLAADWVLFVGAGCRQGLAPESYRGLVRHVLLTCRNAGVSRMTLCLSPPAEQAAGELTPLVAEVLRTMGEHGPDCRLSSFA